MASFIVEDCEASNNNEQNCVSCYQAHSLLSGFPRRKKLIYYYLLGFKVWTRAKSGVHPRPVN